MNFALRLILTLSLLTVTPAISVADDKRKTPPAEKSVTAAPAEVYKSLAAERALKDFKKKIAAIRSLGIQLSAEAKGKPGGGMRIMKETTGKLAAVRTDGLPEDLRTAYDRMAKFWKASSEVYADMPEDDSAVELWAKKKFSDPKFEEKFKPIMIEGRTAGVELAIIAKKYGIDIELPGK